MSDHWNSIANLLGTPSLNPISKKSDSASRAPKPAPVTEATVEEVLTPEAAPAKAKPEPSRLRSSWDAVAQFFGVASPEPEVEVASPKLESIAENNKSQISSSKKKPSMWGDEPEVPAAAESPKEVEIGFAPAERDEVRSREPEVRRGARDRRPRSEPSAPRTAAKSFDTPIEAEPAAEQPVSRGRRSSPAREDRVEPVDPERRSNRRPPRRGRAEGADVVAPVDDVEPVRDGFDLDDEDTDLNRDEPVRAVPARSAENRRDGRGRGRGNRDGVRDNDRPAERGAGERSPNDRVSGDRVSGERSSGDRGAGERSGNERAERGPRPERTSERTSDRGERNDRGDRKPRSEQGRPSRDDRGPREPASRDGASRDGGGRAAAHREPGHRDDRRPSAPAKPKATGFGAGLHDEEFVYDDEPVLEHDEFMVVDDESAPVAEKSEGDLREGRPKRRRGRGRGRRGERAPDSGDDREVAGSDRAGSDRDEGDDDSSVGRHTKIPSWQEAIGALVATNMENHQRNPNQSRGQRGRGPRRDR